jgi:cytochrome c oxidase assembly factor CtaG
VALALDRPGGSTLLTQWTVQPVALALAAALAFGYAWVLRRAGRPWPRGRVATFAAGLVVLVWTANGFPAVYAKSLYWMWTAQVLALWLVVPTLLLAGRPVGLGPAVPRVTAAAQRLLAARPVRAVANPLVGPALLPAISAVLFFGPLPDWALRYHAVDWLLQLVLLCIGAVLMLPLCVPDDRAGSLAVGLALGVGMFELVLDALPGIVLRLHNSLVSAWFDHRHVHAWTPAALHDQQVAGAILWCVAELIDLPFLVLVYRRWLRSDAREAREIDAVLEAERISRNPLAPSGGPAGDAPWWLDDPQMQERMRRGR